MTTFRRIFRTFLLTLIFAVGANSVVMAASDVMNQEQCLHAIAQDATPDNAHDHHTGHIAKSDDSVSKHDHETCMMHACPAVAHETQILAEIPLSLLTVLSAMEQEFLLLERTDDLLRPPNT